MTSFKQIEANRRNASKSSGPQTEAGKRRSRRNALRHGLTAETVIDGLEDSKDYRSFQRAVASEFDAQTAVERELVLRLANLLWRLRRAIAIETGLFETQTDRTNLDPVETNLSEPGLAPVFALVPNAPLHLTFRQHKGLRADAGNCNHSHQPQTANGLIAICFAGLSDLDGEAFQRLNRYETSLWRQACQVLIMLDMLRRHGLSGAGLPRWARYGKFL